MIAAMACQTQPFCQTSLSSYYSSTARSLPIWLLQMHMKVTSEQIKKFFQHETLFQAWLSFVLSKAIPTAYFSTNDLLIIVFSCFGFNGSQRVFGHVYHGHESVGTLDHAWLWLIFAIAGNCSLNITIILTLLRQQAHKQTNATLQTIQEGASNPPNSYDATLPLPSSLPSPPSFNGVQGYNPWKLFGI